MKKALLIIGALFVAFIIGIIALVGTAVDEASDALNEEAKNDKPSKIDEGAKFTHDKWKVTGNWAVKPDGLGAAKIVRLQVTNVSDDTDTPMLTFQLTKGKSVAGQIECSAHELQPDQTARMDCVSLDQKIKPNAWDTISVRDMW